MSPPDLCPVPHAGTSPESRPTCWAAPPWEGPARALHTVPCHPGTGFGSALPPSWGSGGRNLPEKTSNMGSLLPLYSSDLEAWKNSPSVDPVTLPICTRSPVLKACSGRWRSPRSRLCYLLPTADGGCHPRNPRGWLAGSSTSSFIFFA